MPQPVDRPLAKRSLLTRSLVTACCLVLLASGAALAQAGDNPVDGMPSSGDGYAHPLIDQQITAQEAAEADEQQELSAPVAEAERAESQTQYDDLSSTDAKALARETFELIGNVPAFDPFEPPPGLELEGYSGRFSALVVPEGEQSPLTTPPAADGSVPESNGMIVESLTPLRARDENGNLRPLDSELVPGDGGLGPKNAVTPVVVPSDLADGVDLEGSGISVRPTGAAEAADRAVIGEDQAFYGNFAESSDFIVMPLTTGFRFAIQVRSAEAPETYKLNVSVPDGATLQSQGDSELFAIVRDGEILATVSPPTAVDAQGTPVPTSMHIIDGDLELRVEHRGGETAYPALVDPDVQEQGTRDYYQWSAAYPYGGPPPTDYDYTAPSSAGGTRTYWLPYSPHSSRIGAFFYAGLYNSSLTGTAYYANQQFSQWQWQAPTNTAIERIDFYDTDHYHTPANNFCTTFGIWGNGGWQTGLSRTYTPPNAYNQGASPPSNGVSPKTICPAYTHQSTDVWVGNSTLNDGPGGDVDGALNNVGIFQFFANGSGNRTGQSYNLLRSALIYVADGVAPTWNSSPALPQDKPWLDDGGASHSLSVGASDAGVGMKYFNLWHPNPSNPTQPALTYREHPCFGDRTARCPKSWALTGSDPNFQPLSYNLPEGRNLVTVQAVDFTGELAARQFYQPIDRSAPAVLAPTGSLYTNRANLDGSSRYQLALSATDGSTARADLMRSGVQKIEVFVDNETQPRYTVAQSCAVPEGSCPLNSAVKSEAVWATSPDALPEGAHTVKIIATDMLGHVSPATTFQINVSYSDAPITVREICNGVQPTESELDALAVDADLSVVAEIGEQVFGSRYGDGWVNRSTCPAKRHIVIEDATAAERTQFTQALASDGRVDPNRVVVESLSYTERELDAGADQAGDILASSPSTRFATYAELQNQRVAVSANSLTQAQRDAIEAAVDPPVAFFTDPAFAGLSLLHDRNNFPDFESGLRIAFPFGTCTTAFTMVDGGNFLGSSAGHCGDVGDGTSIGGTPVGNVQRDAFAEGSVADALTIGLDDGSASKRVHLASDEHRGIVGKVTSRGAFGNDEYFCWQGIRSHGCFPVFVKPRVVSALDAVTGQRTNLRRQVCVLGESFGGDSGAGVYAKRPDRAAAAAGVLSSGGAIAPEFPNFKVTCFSRIGNVIDQLGADVAIRGRG